MTRRAWLWLTFGLTVLVLAAIAAYELIASPLQAMLLADYAKRLTYRTEAGPSDRVRFPVAGPFDVRFGYARLPEFRKRLEKEGYTVSRQARLSPEMGTLADYGLFLPYHEKTSAGLTLEDCSGRPYYSSRQPRRVYADFAAVPPVVANTLLFIENRELLDPNHPQRNPAVEWDRLAQAMLEKVVQVVQPGRNVPGGSTLATQIEKYRHSPDGLTMTPVDKLRQMASASVRAYLDGSDTRVTRRRIVRDYLNTVPLAAAPGFGEVNGIGDGLHAWFGLDFDRVNTLLRQPGQNVEAARAYKHVLGLLISQRKPSWYLVGGRKQLDAQANVHLGLLAEAGVISPEFRDLARQQSIAFLDDKAVRVQPKAPNKAIAAMRIELSRMLGVPRLYDLDRIDLTVATTLHRESQKKVSEFLRGLADPAAVRDAGLLGHHLLSAGDDLSKVLYSFTLYELTDDGPALRVQADSLDQPFDINQGAKLDMGSSAKLRTLITYLQLIAELHARYQDQTPGQLARVEVPARDVLTRWAVDYLRRSPNRDLETMLVAAMGRLYSADPTEAFFTGGGLHTFVNFKREDNGRVMDLWEATRNSVNLPFIRLMRDIVRHFMYRSPGAAARILADAGDPRRQYYLARFADQEGRAFLAKFWKKYRGQPAWRIVNILLSHLTAHPVRLAAVHRYLAPEAGLGEFKAFMKERLSNPSAYGDEALKKLYDAYGPDRYNLADRAYIAQVHPLDLWLAAYLGKHPKADWDAAVKASEAARQEGYEWLFKTGSKDAQDIRIHSLMEIEAFQEIHQRWLRLGYPFASLVPSYATAIGSSADRPAALAELIGIVLNDGLKETPASIRRLDFAADTPYHSVFTRLGRPPERIFPEAVARVVRRALIDVVEQGTARRAAGIFTHLDGKLPLGGKTGTGDHRYETYAPDGTVTESRVVNRVATFAFFVGHRFYGVVTAFVPGEEAARFKFTSALPVQILKALAPALQPLVAHGEGRPLPWKKAADAFDAANPLPSTLSADVKPAMPGQAIEKPAEAAMPAPGTAASAEPVAPVQAAEKPSEPAPVPSPSRPEPGAAHPPPGKATERPVPQPEKAAPESAPPRPERPKPAPRPAQPEKARPEPAPARPKQAPERDSIPTPAPTTPGQGFSFF